MSARDLFTLVLAVCGLAVSAVAEDTPSPRHEFSLNTGWRSIAADTGAAGAEDFELPGFNDSAWTRVEVPHNWDDYGGLTRVVHGNRHGTAWYRREFEVAAGEAGRRVYLYFEGVGSYATVWVNGKPAGTHAGGRTTFTLDVTDLVQVGARNLLAVRADHPAGITDLPWVCGGCSSAPGFSEGSQPMGIFRPVTLVTTGAARVEPFGVHVWNNADATADRAVVHFAAEIRNHSVHGTLAVRFALTDADGETVWSGLRMQPAAAGAVTLAGEIEVAPVRLWSPDSPHLYTLTTDVQVEGAPADRVVTHFGVRTLRWPKADGPAGVPFLLNGKPVFINGTCEYEHLLGASHAFGPEQIAARVAQVKATGYNAFRDAHQPHNLRYQDYWDRDGILWWPQFGSQIWFDTPEFRANFKTLLREWVRERRNSPSLVLWGLANESKLPADFAAECVALIRELDPTTSAQRLVTTCNGGKGSDWNVPQNWTGTYGGNPEEYAADLVRQRLVGEYGAWRSLGLHSEGGYVADGPRSEDRADAIFATKIRLAESVRDRVAGHFHWLLATHENPGRTIGSKLQQASDGWAELDRLGPANNKGLLTLWGEPTDAFHLFRASYAPAAKDPMVYIVSHTWPDRWTEPGKKSGILVYSNCEEVELFNDAGARESLGVRRQSGPGVPFRWDDVDVSYDVLHAEARVGGKVAARDSIVLKNLPEAPHRAELRGEVVNLTAADRAWNYLYRVNCGGSDYTDINGVRWSADRDFAEGLSWGSTSWAMDYPGLPARFGSQRESFETIRGTDDQALFQSYRYGRHKLRYRFAVPDGKYRVELYFAEPWYGAGGGDCAGWRLFDVAVNDATVLRDVDLWREAGFAKAVKKVVSARARDGWLEISFPRVASYQAVISAIAVASADTNARASQDRPQATPAAVQPVPRVDSAAPVETASVAAENVYPVAQAKREGAVLTWRVQLGLGGSHDFSVRYSNPGAGPRHAELKVLAPDGTLMGAKRLTLVPAASAIAALDGVGMNAGDYTVTLSLPDGGEVRVDALLVK